MREIKRILNNSRNGDVSALVSLIVKALKTKDWEGDAFMMTLIGELSKFDEALTEALNRLRIYSQMASLDELRDEAVRSLFKLVEGYVHIPVDKLREAAVSINEVLEQYGAGLQYDDYSEESAKINSLLKDLENADLVAAISSLQGVSDSIKALSEAQDNFEKLALEQAEGEGAKRNLATASKLKKVVRDKINNNLRPYLNTMSMVNSATYGEISNTIAELIDKNNEAVRRRKNADHNNDEPLHKDKGGEGA